jgi:hypothetical protein
LTKTEGNKMRATVVIGTIVKEIKTEHTFKGDEQQRGSSELLHVGFRETESRPAGLTAKDLDAR